MNIIVAGVQKGQCKPPDGPSVQGCAERGRDQAVCNGKSRDADARYP